MTLAQTILPQFDHEMALTRKVLERIPENNLGWAPHPKSFTMIALAAHLAFIPTMGLRAITTESYDIAPVGGEPRRPPVLNSRPEVLAAFDENVTTLRAALAGVSDESMLEPWSLLAGGKPRFTMPRVGVIRGIVLSHMIHHRGQLTVYLRLCDVPIPSIYGPSADEQI
jgi:uncharacterized damage-inducible protein DinB